MAAVAPFVVPLLPLAVPRLRTGFKRIVKKYNPSEVAPNKPVTNPEPFKGVFPERDVLGNSLLQHLVATGMICGSLLMAALKIAKEKPDSPYALGLTFSAAAFAVDLIPHLWLAGDDKDEKAADGNLMQKGHELSQPFFAALIAFGSVVVCGEKNPSGMSNVPDLGFNTLLARFFMHPAVLTPVNLWQTAHALNAFKDNQIAKKETSMKNKKETSMKNTEETSMKIQKETSMKNTEETSMKIQKETSMKNTKETSMKNKKENEEEQETTTTASNAPVGLNSSSAA